MNNGKILTGKLDKFFDDKEKEETKWQKIKSFFIYKFKLERLRINWRDFKQGIKNLIIWFPIIWKDRNWDYIYIYIILIKKLELTRDTIKRNQIVADANDIADQINYTIVRLQRVKNDFESYDEPINKIHDEKWGESVFEWIPYSDTENPEKKDLLELKITRPNVKTPEDDELEYKEFMEGKHKVNNLRKTDLKEALDNIYNNIENWWD